MFFYVFSTAFLTGLDAGALWRWEYGPRNPGVTLQRCGVRRFAGLVSLRLLPLQVFHRFLKATAYGFSWYADRVGWVFAGQTGPGRVASVKAIPPTSGTLRCTASMRGLTELLLVRRVGH